MKLKKMLAIILALSLIMTNSSMIVFAETMDDPGVEVENALDIASGETKTIFVNPNNGETMLKFIPNVSGKYSFKSLSSRDPYAYLYDCYRDELEYGDDSETLNFYIEYYLEKGQTYYLGVGLFGDEDIECEVRVTLTCISGCDHEDTFDVTGTDATCYTDGYTAGIKCDICGSWVDGPETIEGCHYDNTEDGICDRCEKQMHVENGTCGGNLLYEETFDGAVKYYLYANGTLEIYGEGEVQPNAFSFDEGVTSIKKVFVGEGITRIGYSAFFACNEMTEITLMNPSCSISGEYDTIPNRTTIIGHEGSPAEVYASEYDREFLPYCPHETVTEKEAVEATCYVDGYTAGTLCNDCDRWASGHDRIEAKHTDADENEICDSCKKSLRDMETGTCGGYPVGEEEESYDGSAKYYLYEDGTLEIYGEGSVRPWAYDYFDSCEDIKTIYIAEGISKIGWAAFECCYNVSEITIMNPECQIADSEETLPYRATLIGHEDSTADTYALEYDRDFLAYCAHENVTEVDAVEASCNSFGYTAGAICDDCERYAYGHDRLVVSHNDDDEDNICDRCEKDMPVDSGDCDGNNYEEEGFVSSTGSVKYYLYEDGTLEIYGDGRVGAFSFEDMDAIKRVIVREGVTEIGDSAFWGCSNMTEITILNPDCMVEWFEETVPEYVTVIGYENSTAEAYAAEHDRDFLEYCPHENAVEVPKTEAKCNAYGYTEGDFCNDCKRWFSGHDRIVIRHSDDDEDNICDRCERIMPVRSGQCGGFDDEEGTSRGVARYYEYADGTLEIYGEGGIESWFFEYKPSIKKVIIGEGIAEIGSYAFGDSYNIEEITILNPECQFPEYSKIEKSNATIIGHLDSTAQSYAQRWGNTFKKYCTHENCEEKAAVTAGCYTDGYTAGELCTDCSEWAVGHERIKASHIDEDDNNICERCEKSLPIEEGNCGEQIVTEEDEETARYSDSVRYYKYADGTVEIFGAGAIGKRAFESEDYEEGDSDIKNVIIYDGITEIQSRAFSGCYGLKSITIPASVTKIGIYAFRSCSELESVILSDDTESIEWSTFEKCYDVTFYVSGKAEDVIKHLKKKRYTYELKPESISIVSDAKRNFYEKGEEADLSGLVLQATYEDGTTKRIKRGFALDGFDSSRVGMQAISVTYGGVKTSYDVRVIDEIELEYTSTIYDGDWKRPAVTVQGLASDEYSVSYENNREDGCASVLITGKGDYRGAIVKQFVIKFSAPKDVKVTTVASTGLPKITWSKVSGAPEYNVYRATSKSGTYRYVGWTESTSFVDSGAAVGKTYYYKVKAISYYSEEANSVLSDYDYATCDLSRPTISISNVASTGKIKLSWNAVEDADRYEIQRSVGNDDNYVSYKTTTSKSFTNTSTNAGTTYYYRVRAIYDDKSAANSAWAYEYQTCDLAAPEITVSGTKSPGKIVVSWDEVEDADRYYIYRATSKNGTYSKYSTTTKTTYTNSSVTKGKTYYYKVIAVYDGKSTANSAYSNTDYATVR